MSQPLNFRLIQSLFKKIFHESLSWNSLQDCDYEHNKAMKVEAH